MKYGIDSSLAEIHKRKTKLLHRRAQRKTLFMGGVTAALMFMTVLSFVLVVPHGGNTPGQSPYGAFLVDGGGGGYVLVGVLAFAFGAAFTLLCIWFTKLKKAKSTEKTDQEDQKTED